jgi:hypothetical protein
MRIEDLLFTIEDWMLSSVAGLAQPVRGGQLNTASWTVECFHQCIHGDPEIAMRFCNMLHEYNLLTSEGKPSKIRAPLRIRTPDL